MTDKDFARGVDLKACAARKEGQTIQMDATGHSEALSSTNAP